MLKMRIFGVIPAALLAAACGGSSGPANTFTAALTNSDEFPAPPVASTATGTATYTVSGTTVNYTITFSGLTGPVTASHIHIGAKGAAGGVVVPFAPPAVAAGTFTGSFTTADVKPQTTPIVINTLDDLLVQMRAGNTYTNIHTASDKGGEIRGQNLPK